MTDVATAPVQSGNTGWISRLLSRASFPCSFHVHTPGGETIAIGDAAPEFAVHIRNERGLRALRSTEELRIADAYVRGDLDIEGDAIKAMWLRNALSDRNAWLKIWRRVQPMIFGREKLNPEWIAKHYDSNNVQLLALDRDYYAYTPGIYLNDGETLEQSSQRKYEFAWDSLRLQPGQELLEIGCGWGGMTRFCASRGVRVTGITLSKHQLGFTRELIAKHGLNADAHFQDFFTYQPGRRFDAISCMGVIEDLSDYPRVMQRFSDLLKPGARAYLDYAAGKVPFGTSSFITKYVWPGTFRMVYVPELLEAIDQSRMQLVGLYNDRHNYHLWARNGHRRWVENRAKVIAQAGEQIYRLFNLLFIGTSGVMNDPAQKVTAYRMVLELAR
ncbi:MAG TPA: class I SAM-dependent methyltransferase [Thermoanaerobaculia bacterium]|nr:class I SAM-dependent methyltransferase [Thermoanaerobaculia bacterium]